MERIRCDWTKNITYNNEYHDNEWGVPVHDDKKLFELLILEAFQAGLSWLTILKKRENFRKALDNFDAELISKYDKNKSDLLMKDEGIIRNRLKIEAIITNAKVFLLLSKEFGSFDHYIWQFVNNKTIVNKWNSITEVPAKSKESDNMSINLKKRGFKFVGSTICYSFMQAAGMINDHTVNCFRYAQINELFFKSSHE
jgi:DNA-3-methyladenine glycosylase I